MRVIESSAFRSMPWKNGKGVTTEIHREDDAAGDMLWRVSMAGVTEDGPFSSFPGYDRHILALTGDGMDLVGGPDGTIRVAPLFTPHPFSGDWPVEARLLGGPLTDFNLIIRRNWASGCLMVWDNYNPAPRSLPRGTRLLWLQSGTAQLSSSSVSTGQACLLESGENVTLVTSPGTRIIACTLQPAC